MAQTRTKTKARTKRQPRGEAQAAPAALAPQKPAKAPQTRAPRPRAGERAKGDRARALAVLASVGVVPGHRGDPELVQLAAFFQMIEPAEAKRKAAKAQEQREYQTLDRVLASLPLKTEAAQGLRDCFLHDLRGETPLTLSQHRMGLRPVRYLNPKESKPGRPNDPAIGRTIRDFADVYGWSWEVCAAAVFVSGADKRSYAAIKKSFRDVARRTARR